MRENDRSRSANASHSARPRPRDCAGPELAVQRKTACCAARVSWRTQHGVLSQTGGRFRSVTPDLAHEDPVIEFERFPVDGLARLRRTSSRSLGSFRHARAEPVRARGLPLQVRRKGARYRPSLSAEARAGAAAGTERAIQSAALSRFRSRCAEWLVLGQTADRAGWDSTKAVDCEGS